MEFTNQVVVVTGGGKGIGFAVAQGFLQQGAKVILAELDPELGAQAQAKLQDMGSVQFIPTDVGCPDSIQVLAKVIESTYGKLDVLINNAGIGVNKTIEELSIEEWDRVLNVNLRSIFLCAKYLLPLLRKGSTPAIINLASTRAFMSEAHTLPYTASKGGIVALTHGLAVSLAKEQIRVNCISPGWIETGQYAQLRDIDHVQHPAGRVGYPEDIAQACLYLASPRAGFVTGTNLTIDGGMTKKMIYVE